jgi:hypothetical protein
MSDSKRNVLVGVYVEPELAKAFAESAGAMKRSVSSLGRLVLKQFVERERQREPVGVA